MSAIRSMLYESSVTKEVDEIVVLDIDASREGREPEYELIAEMAGEAFMPMAYGEA